MHLFLEQIHNTERIKIKKILFQEKPYLIKCDYYKFIKTKVVFKSFSSKVYIYINVAIVSFKTNIDK